MEEVQVKQIDPIYFETFLKKYFTKQLVESTHKIHQYLHHHHLLLLHQRSHPIHRIVKYAVKLSKRQLVEFNQKDHYQQKDVVLLQLNNIDQESLEILQSRIKSCSKDALNLRFIILAEIDSPETIKIFSEYSFIQSYFFNIVIPPLT